MPKDDLQKPDEVSRPSDAPKTAADYDAMMAAWDALQKPSVPHAASQKSRAKQPPTLPVRRRSAAPQTPRRDAPGFEVRTRKAGPGSPQTAHSVGGTTAQTTQTNGLFAVLEEVVLPAPRAERKGDGAYYASVVMTALFTALLTFVGLINLLVPDRSFSENENRMLEPMPALSLSSIVGGSFMSKFETSVTDQFIFRDFFVQMKTRLLIALGKSAVNDVYICDDGYLISHPAPPDTACAADTLAAIDAFAAEYPGIPQYCAFVPRASFILREKLPRGAAFYDEQSLLDSALAACVSPNVVNVRTADALTEAAETEQVYYRTDHHWTTRGAYVGLEAIAPAMGIDLSTVSYSFLPLSDSFAGTLASNAGMFKYRDMLEICVPTQPVSKYYITTDSSENKTASVFVPEKLAQKDQYEVFFGGNPGLVNISTDSPNTQKLLLFKDSYANCMVSMLTPFFQRIVMIDPRYYMDSLDDLMTKYDFDAILYLFSFESLFNTNTLLTMLGGSASQ